MGWVCRCPFCEKVLVAATDDANAFRTLILSHMIRCAATPPALTFGAAAVIVDHLVSQVAEDDHLISGSGDNVM